jgi:uncharacterized protein DUF6308
VDAIVLRSGVELPDPLDLALAFLEAYGSDEAADATEHDRFGESDLRRANRGGARISAAEIASVLERRPQIEAALRAIDPAASLTDRSIPWAALTRLFAGFADLRGVGLAKTTKALHPKRPALIPLLDSVVQAYLEPEPPKPAPPFAEHATALVRAYKRDLDRNRVALRELRRALATRGYDLTATRLLDVLIWSAYASRG